MTSAARTSAPSHRAAAAARSSGRHPPPPSNGSHSPPLKRYFSRRHSSRPLRTNDLPLEKGARGVYTPSGIAFVCIKLTVPLAYVYILLVLLRELCVTFPDGFHGPVRRYLPYLATIISMMHKSSILMEVWAVVEAIFYICLRVHMYWLQSKDPLEASLSAAPMMELDEREELWVNMMRSEMEDPVSFLTGWFFDEKLETITKYDLLDFVAWSMFEGRHQEHLTHDELRQLNGFVDEIEWRISIHMYGFEPPASLHDESEDDGGGGGYASSDTEASRLSAAHASVTSSVESHLPAWKLSELHWSPHENERVRPRKYFRFPECSLDEESTYFSNLYESYKQKYEDYRQRLENVHPVQDLVDFVAEKRQRIYEAEENAIAAASQMYESAYYRVLDKGGNMDRRITALSHATQTQLSEAWHRMTAMKERLTLSTATRISNRRKALRQQLKGYNLLLDRMRAMSSSVPSKQMVGVMRKITQCHEAMEGIESSARDAFVKATGFARESLFEGRNEPRPYAKYSSDPLLGLAIYPLAFHILILGLTDGGLRILMRMRGFQRKKIGQISYYYHPGTAGVDDDAAEEEERIPVVFCHGIGIGLITYLSLIDGLLRTGRPLFLPEIPYVSGFRPWQSPHSILPPASVTSLLTAMLASHGFLRAVFVGHSYGTSWLSYMCKYSPSVTAGVIFLDPICFCLYTSHLVRHFVYHRSDPGSVSYMIRTDVIINWTIQRSFPWGSISLFSEQLPDIPCSIFLSEQDALVPATRVEKYLRSKGAPVKTFDEADEGHFAEGPINVTVLVGEGHGDWLEAASKSTKIASAVEVLCCKVDAEDENYKTR